MYFRYYSFLSGGNVLCVNLWGQQSGPYMQAMHFSFGAGAFIAPLLAEPFLKSNTAEEKYVSPTPTPAVETADFITQITNNLTTTGLESTINSTSDVVAKSRKKRNDSPTATPTTKITKIWKVQPLKFQYAFVVIGLLLIIISFLFTAVCCCGARGSPATKNSEIQGHVLKKEPTGFRLKVMVMLFVFYFFYVGMEVTYGALCATFAIEKFEWHKDKAAYLTAAFWGSFAFARFAAIFLARIFSSSKILIGDLVMTLLSLLALVLMTSYKHYEYVVWICTLTFGAGMASIFPTGLVWAENYMKITGKAASVFVVASALGEMALPLSTSFAMGQSKNPMYLMYILLTCAFLAGCIFICLLRLASNQGVRYQSVDKQITSHRLSKNRENATLEMEGINNEAFTHEAAGTGPARRHKPSFKGGAKAD